MRSLVFTRRGRVANTGDIGGATSAVGVVGVALLAAMLSLLGACATSPDVLPRAAASDTASAATSQERVLHVDGDLAPRTLGLDDLRRLGVVQVEWSQRGGGGSRVYDAVPLDELLHSLGATLGTPVNTRLPAAEKRAAWKFVAVATASDGFQAAFTFAEVSAGMGPTRVFLAIGQDGRPLDEAVGPFRLLVPTDGDRSRSAHNVLRLTILDLRRCVPPELTAR